MLLNKNVILIFSMENSRCYKIWIPSYKTFLQFYITRNSSKNRYLKLPILCSFSLSLSLPSKDDCQISVSFEHIRNFKVSHFSMAKGVKVNITVTYLKGTTALSIMSFSIKIKNVILNIMTFYAYAQYHYEDCRS